MGSHTSLHDAGNRRRHLRGYHHGPGENRRPVNRLNTQPENNLHHALGHYRVETQIGRWKGVIGPKLKARSFENQKTEDRSQDRRHRSQRNDRPWPPRIRGGHVTMFKGNTNGH